MMPRPGEPLNFKRGKYYLAIPSIARMPHHPGDPGKLLAYAFGYGYIDELINAANSEVS
jgi:hypothetical protein